MASEQVASFEPQHGILGHGEIVARLRSKDLVISPILSKDQLGAASVDLRMGTVALMVRARGASHVDPSDTKRITQRGIPHDIEVGRQQKHERYEIPFKTRFLLHPGTLVLVPTLEWVSLPGNLLGTVTARSTWAREGLSIATATLIEPYYHGIITLELSNLGQIPITLYPGLRLAQIALVAVSGDARRSNPGQFALSFEPKQGTIASEDDFPFIP
jgi:dCTP deaminase